MTLRPTPPPPRRLGAWTIAACTPAFSQCVAPRFIYHPEFTLLMQVARPYWTEAEEKQEAKLQLAGIVALTLGTTGAHQSACELLRRLTFNVPLTQQSAWASTSLAATFTTQSQRRCV